jgi:hypothetical protein
MVFPALKKTKEKKKKKKKMGHGSSGRAPARP